MTEITLSPELARNLDRLARYFMAASRAVSLYPAEHPAVGKALEGLQRTIREATGGVTLSIGVTPSTLLIEGAAGPSDGAVAEAAALLHGRDLLEVTFWAEVSQATLRAFMALVCQDPLQLREDGGPVAVWQRGRHAGITLEQVDYASVLADRRAPLPATKDDLWRAIVRGVNERHKTLDEAAQQRLLQIVGDVDAIGELAADVMAPARMPDGSPMVTTQAAAVLATYRHLVGVVAVMAPERAEEVIRNLATVTSRLEPRVMLQVMAAEDEPGDGDGVAAGLRRAFDDANVAQLLATTLAIDGTATQRLADVFDTIAPDVERKRRVLRLTQSLLKGTEFGQQTQFSSLWSSMESLLLNYDERPFVSGAYGTSLDSASERAEAMATSGLPLEAAEWVRTLGQDNVRRLSVTLVIDLLNLERDPARAPDLANDLGALAADLLMQGDYALAERVVVALAAKATDPTAVTSRPARNALDQLADSAAMRETAAALGDMDDGQADTFSNVCRQVGARATEALLPQLSTEELTRARKRASAVVVEFGAPAAAWLGPLVSSDRWYAQRNAAELLGLIGAPEGVPLLQTLVRSPDARVTREAVRALSHIDDPAAARAIHTVLRASTGEARKAVIDALVAEGDPRVVPVLLRILNESKPLGGDRFIVLETLAALGVLRQDAAIPDILRLMRRKSLFRRRRMRAVKQRSLEALLAINTPVARAAIKDAALTGDRMLRRMARAIPA